jgi:hypothetical protein
MAAADAAAADTALKTAALKRAISQPAAQPYTSPPQEVMPEPMGPALVASGPCCPAPCIIYRHRGPAICRGCAPPVPTVLNVVNPCTCCPVAITVCLPACCTGVPVVCSKPGVFATNVVTYVWPGGYSVTVRFRRSGEVVVVTRGV